MPLSYNSRSCLCKQILKNQNLTTDAAKQEVQILTNCTKQNTTIHRAHIKCMRYRNLHRGRGKGLQQGGAPQARAQPLTIAASRTTRSGTMENEIPSPREKMDPSSLGSTQAQLKSAPDRPRLPQGGTSHPRNELKQPVPPPRRREHAQRGRSAVHARASPQNYATRASLFVITAPVMQKHESKRSTTHGKELLRDTDLSNELGRRKGREERRIPWPSWSPPRGVSLARLLLRRRRQRRGGCDGERGMGRRRRRLMVYIGGEGSGTLGVIRRLRGLGLGPYVGRVSWKEYKYYEPDRGHEQYICFI